MTLICDSEFIKVVNCYSGNNIRGNATVYDLQ